MSTSLDDTGAQQHPDDVPDVPETVVDLTRLEAADDARTAGPDQDPGTGTGTGTDTGSSTDAAGEAAPLDGAAGAEQTRPRLHGWVRLVPWLVMLGFLPVYLISSLTRYGRLLTASPDLAIFEQAIQGYSKFKAPIVGVKAPGFNLLGDHFHPLLAVMGPFYRLWPTPVTILTLQSVLFALSIVPVTRVAMARLGTRTGLALGLAYGWSWGLQSAVDFDFHEICLAVPIIAFVLEAILNRRYWLAAALSLLLLGVKEELTMTVAAIALVLFLRRKRLLGLVLAVIGFASFWLIIYKIIPHFNPDGVYPYTFAMEGAAHHAWWQLPIEMVWPRTKLLTVAYVLGITGFVALRSPISLILLPTFVWRFHSDPPYWGTGWQYNAILMPVVFVATVEVIERWRTTRHDRLRRYVGHVPTLAVAVAVALTPSFPFGRIFTDGFWHDEGHVKGARAAMALVPDGAVVEANVGVQAALVHRAEVYFPGEADVLPDVVIIDKDWDSLDTQQAVSWAQETYPEAAYAVKYADDRFTVLVMTDAGKSGDSGDQG